MINHLGFWRNDGAVTGTLEDPESAPCGAASLDLGAQRSAPKRQGFSEAEQSGYLAWEASSGRLLSVAVVSESYVLAQFWHFSHTPKAVLSYVKLSYKRDISEE